MSHKQGCKHNKRWIMLGVICAALLLLGALFYGVYLYRPYLIASGGRLAGWDVSLQSGMLVVSTNYTWPDGTPPETVERAMALEDGVISEDSIN